MDGTAGAILDGLGTRELLVVHADSVTIRGVTFRNTGASQATDRAALRIADASFCVVDGNRFDNTLFGIYLQRVTNCQIRHNALRDMRGRRR